jgi:large subunit ribosomal protein L15
MQTHQLKALHKSTTRKRIGRGGKRGNYSGRGSKGQRSRAGAKIRPQLREIINKFPKKRGEGFYFQKTSLAEVNLVEIKKKFPKGGKISPKTLRKVGLLDSAINKQTRVKILGGGALAVIYNIENCSLSKKAQEAVLKAGGKIKVKNK